MSKNTNLIIVVFGVILLVMVGYFLFFSGNGGGGGGGIIEKKVSVTCDVTISNSPLSNLKLSDVYCVAKEVTICGFTTQSFTDSGNLKFTSSTNHVNTQVSVGEFGSKTYKVSLCGMPVGTNTGKFEIFTDNKITDTQTVTFQPA